MKNKVKILVFLSALLLITGSVYADVQSEGHPGPGDGPKFHHPGFHHHNQLNLSPDQKARLKELRDNFKKDTVFLRNSLKVKRLELRALWTVPQPEKDKILTKQREIMDLVSQLQAKAVDFRLEARKALTPEQAAQVGMWGPEMFRRHLRDCRMRAEF